MEMDSDMVKSCTKNIVDVIESTQFEVVCEKFQSFITIFKEILLKFEGSDFSQKHCSTQLQDHILLCFSQLRKCLLMMTLVLKGNLKSSVVPAEPKAFICQRMILCIEKLNEVSKEVFRPGDENGIISEINDEDLSGGLFITHMDHALSLLAVFEAGLSNDSAENMSLSQCRIVVENLLGHAMTISQVASSLDLKEIHCSCEKILHEFENLRKVYENEKRNICECKLYTVSLTAALEKLEQRVCSAVLKMYLTIFSDSSAPLRTLVRACWKEPTNEEKRSAHDVDNFVSAFDAHMDKLVQVALFAVACSTSQSLVRSIRSCLASLESIEPHLVPALQALYLRKTDREELKQFVRFLTEHWIDEVQSLSGFIDLIVDPAALAQVTYDEGRIPAAALKKAIAKEESVSSDEIHKMVASVVAPVSVLVHQLHTVGKSPDVKPTPRLSKAIEDIRQSLHHLKESSRLPESDDLSKRCLKRCEVVLTCIKTAIPLLEEAFSVESKAPAASSPLKFPESVRELPQDISTPWDDPACNPKVDTGVPVGEDSCKKILELSRTGRTSLRSTSILYKERKTPKRQSTGSKLLRSVLMEHARRSGLKRRTSVFNRTAEFSGDTSKTSVMQETLGLTALLDDLSSVSKSLKSEQLLPVPVKQNGSQRVPNQDLSEDEYASCLELSIDSGRSSSIDTPQRLKDLAALRERIDALRKAHDLP